MKPWDQARAAATTSAARLIDPNAGGALIASNTATAIASGPEANGHAIFMNGVVQWLKRFSWYDQHVWALPTLIVLGVGIAVALDPDHIRLALKYGINLVGQSWINVRALSPDPIMPPGG